MFLGLRQHSSIITVSGFWPASLSWIKTRLPMIRYGLPDSSPCTVRLSAFLKFWKKGWDPSNSILKQLMTGCGRRTIDMDSGLGPGADPCLSGRGAVVLKPLLFPPSLCLPILLRDQARHVQKLVGVAGLVLLGLKVQHPGNIFRKCFLPS